jgi:hypothetical protein
VIADHVRLSGYATIAAIAQGTRSLCPRPCVFACFSVSQSVIKQIGAAPIFCLCFLCLFFACSSCHNVDGRQLHASQLYVFSCSYPTILYFRAGGEEPVAYKGKRNVEAFKEFVEATRTGAQNTNTQ